MTFTVPTVWLVLALFAMVFAFIVAIHAVAVSRATRCLRDQIERAERWVKA